MVEAVHRYLFIYQEKKDHTLMIRRVYSGDDTIFLPPSIGGLPVTEVDTYAFSTPHGQEPEGKSWYGEAVSTFSWNPEEENLRRIRQKAETSVNEVFWRGEDTCPPGWNPTDFQTPAAGKALHNLYLPDTLTAFGRYALYNCSCLKNIRFSSRLKDIGGGALVGCTGLSDLTIRIFPAERSGLREVLTELNQYLTVHSYREEQGGETARIYFPDYYEEAIENSPAHLFQWQVQGCGLRFRHCFKDTAFQFSECDSQFSWVRDQETEEVTAEFVLARLRFPFELSAEASETYREWLRMHIRRAAEHLIRAKETENFRYLASSPDRTREELELLTQMANTGKETELVSFLMNIRHSRFPEKKKKTFDF